MATIWMAAGKNFKKKNKSLSLRITKRRNSSVKELNPHKGDNIESKDKAMIEKWKR